MKTKLLFSLIALAAAISAPRAEKPNVKDLRESARTVIGVIPEKMPGADKDTPALIALGEKLFFENRLSQNGSMSCNSCHQVDKARGGVDNEPTSPGAFGKRGGRNSPTVLNAGFQFAQFWDGRAANLEAQAKGPILNPIEMAMPTEKEVLARLKTVPEYNVLFAKAFPETGERISYDNLARAIAAYERTLVTHDRFDDWLHGDDKALNDHELRGLNLFLSTGCTTCHSGPVLGGNQFQKVGLVNPYQTTDAGRYEVTKEESDKQKFKVPMLRNVALTGPYFHDGQQKTLEETAKKMAWLQLGKELTDAEAHEIAAFLITLTDKTRAKDQ